MVFQAFWIVGYIIFAIKCLKLKRKLNYRSATGEFLDGVWDELLNYYRAFVAYLKLASGISQGINF